MPDRIAYSFVVEQRMAATAVGYTWTEYLDLPGDPWAMDDEDGDCKAFVVILYRYQQVLKAMEWA